MFKKILLPTDGSDLSVFATRAAVGLAKSQDAQVVGVYVIDPFPYIGIGDASAIGLQAYLTEAKAALVYSRLAKRLRALGLRSFRDYCALIDGADGLDERQAMFAALTTNVTRFYREPHHFDHLRDKVMPALAERARS